MNNVVPAMSYTLLLGGWLRSARLQCGGKGWVFQENPPPLEIEIQMKLAKFLTHARTARGMKFEEHPWNGRRHNRKGSFVPK